MFIVKWRDQTIQLEKEIILGKGNHKKCLQKKILNSFSEKITKPEIGEENAELT